MTAMLTVSIWHNVTRDPEGRHTGFGGFTPGDEMVKVFTYDLPPGGRRDLTALAENAFAIGNGAPGLDGRAAELAARYARRMLRSLSVGDVVAVGEVGLAVGHVGWTLVRGGLNEVRTDEHGTHPLPPDAQRGTGRLPSQEGQDDATRD
jgi:hypothetical protein